MIDFDQKVRDETLQLDTYKKNAQAGLLTGSMQTTSIRWANYRVSTIMMMMCVCVSLMNIQYGAFVPESAKFMVVSMQTDQLCDLFSL